MELTITQREEDLTDYIALFCEFLTRNSIKTKEQLELSFDILACEFAMLHNGQYVRDETRMIF